MPTAVTALRSLLDGPLPWRRAAEVAACARSLASSAGRPGVADQLMELSARLDAESFRRSALELRLASPSLEPRDADAVVAAVTRRRSPALDEALCAWAPRLERSLPQLLEAVARLGDAEERASAMGALAEALAGRPAAERLAAPALRELDRADAPTRLAVAPLLLPCVAGRARMRLLRQVREDIAAVPEAERPGRAATLLSALPPSVAQELGAWLVREEAGSEPLCAARLVSSLARQIGPGALSGLAGGVAQAADPLQEPVRTEALLLLVEGLGGSAPPQALEAARSALERARPEAVAPLLARLSLAPLTDEAFGRLVEGCASGILARAALVDDPWSRAEAVRSLLEAASGCSGDGAALAALEAVRALPGAEHRAHVLSNTRAHWAARDGLRRRAEEVAVASIEGAAAIPELRRRLEVLRGLAAVGPGAAERVRSRIAPEARELARRAAAERGAWERASCAGSLASLVGPGEVAAALGPALDEALAEVGAIRDQWLRLDAVLSLASLCPSGAEEALERAVERFREPAQRARALARARDRPALRQRAERLAAEGVGALLPSPDIDDGQAVEALEAAAAACDGAAGSAAVAASIDGRAPRAGPMAMPGVPSWGEATELPWGALAACGRAAPPPSADAASLARELLPASCLADDLGAALLVEGEPLLCRDPDAAALSLLGRLGSLTLSDTIEAAEALAPSDPAHPLARLGPYLSRCREVLEGKGPPDLCPMCPASGACELLSGPPSRALLSSVPAICEAPSHERAMMLRDLAWALKEGARRAGPVPQSVPVALSALGAHLGGRMEEDEALLRLIDLLLFPPECVRRMKAAAARAGASSLLEQARRALAAGVAQKGAPWARRALGLEDPRALEVVLRGAGPGAAPALAKARAVRRALEAEARPLTDAALEAGRAEAAAALERAAHSSTAAERREALLGALDARSLAAVGRSARAMSSLDAEGELGVRAAAAAMEELAQASDWAQPTKLPIGAGQDHASTALPGPQGACGLEGAPAGVRAGYSYLVIEPKPDTGLRLVALAQAEGRPAMCITRTNPAILRQRYSLPEGVVVRWLTDDQNIERVTLSPSHIDAAQAIKSFVDEHPAALVLLDGMEYLIGRNGFESVLTAVQSLRDRVSLGDASLLVTVSRFALGERELTLLQRELEPLRPEGP